MPAEGLLAAIADAGPLIHLDELDVLVVLEAFTEVLVPSVVAGEADHHRPGWLDRAPAVVGIEDPDSERVSAMMELGALDPGEAAALALWETRNDAIVLCDDLQARRHAESMGCSIAGTLGLLLRAARTHQMPRERVTALLLELPTRTTLHLRPSLLTRAIQTIDDDE